MSELGVFALCNIVPFLIDWVASRRTPKRGPFSSYVDRFNAKQRKQVERAVLLDRGHMIEVKKHV